MRIERVYGGLRDDGTTTTFALHMNHSFRTLFSFASTLVLATSAVAQDSVSVAAGPQYAASGIKAVLLGADYRDAWATRIRVPVLDLDRYAGGITATERGGGNQTISLRFQSTDGREYTFRSVDKYPRLPDEPALAGTVVGAVIQDQVSSLHPAAALIVAPILDAVGVLHPEPMLAVMPDDPDLGEFREEFAGMLGLIEERPDEQEGDRPGFGGFTKIVATETLFGWYDASVGVVLLGNGKGGFAPAGHAETGFFVDGDAKAAAELMVDGNRSLLLVSQNGDSLKVFASAPAGRRNLRLQPLDAFAVVTLSDGSTRREEFHHGSTFLSQSSRFLALPAGARRAVIHDFAGRSREVEL